MHYIIYKTTNTVNGKFYIGKHKTSTLSFDGYLGSGKLLKNAIKKYGADKFERETLFIFETNEEASLKEAELISAEFLIENSEYCYNLHIGGVGGSGSLVYDENGTPSIKATNISENGRKSISEKLKGTAVYHYADGSKRRIAHTHDDVISGFATIPKSNTSVYVLNNKKVVLSVDDPRVISGEAIHCLKGIKCGDGGFKKGTIPYLSEDGQTIVLLSKEEGISRGLKTMNTKTSVYRYPDGSTTRLRTDHPDVLSKLAVGINTGRKMKLFQCPHCLKETSISNIKKHHNEKCKSYINLEE